MRKNIIYLAVIFIIGVSVFLGEIFIGLSLREKNNEALNQGDLKGEIIGEEYKDTYLFLDRNECTAEDLDSIKNYIELKSMTLWNFTEEEIRELEPVDSLEEIEIWFTDIKGELPILLSENLKRITLNTCNIGDVNIARKGTLEKLDLSYNNISNLDFLQGMDELQELYITGNRLENVEPIVQLHKLQTLYIGYNPIKDYNCLRELNWKNLKFVSFSGLSVEDIMGIMPEEKDGIEGLALSEMELENIDFLGEFKNLEYISLNKNKITSLEALEKNKKLKFIYARDNDIDSLEGIESFKNIKILDLRGNQLIFSNEEKMKFSQNNTDIEKLYM